MSSTILVDAHIQWLIHAKVEKASSFTQFVKLGIPVSELPVGPADASQPAFLYAEPCFLPSFPRYLRILQTLPNTSHVLQSPPQHLLFGKTSMPESGSLCTSHENASLVLKTWHSSASYVGGLRVQWTIETLNACNISEAREIVESQGRPGRLLRGSFF